RMEELKTEELNNETAENDEIIVFRVIRRKELNNLLQKLQELQ
ncbi:3976_t:CDS:1, partial [Racocetra fulgida]